jgi:hypothetical protein
MSRKTEFGAYDKPNAARREYKSDLRDLRDLVIAGREAPRRQRPRSLMNPTVARTGT